jgi:hypothetical protein
MIRAVRAGQHLGVWALVIANDPQATRNRIVSTLVIANDLDEAVSDARCGPLAACHL